MAIAPFGAFEITMGQGGSKSEGQFLPIWDCSGGIRQGSAAPDPKLMSILSTKPPRRKKKKMGKRTRSDSLTKEQYFICELKYRKQLISEVFGFYSIDKERLFFSRLRELAIDAEDYDIPRVDHMTKVAGSKHDISEGAILQLLLKLRGEQNPHDSNKSFVRKDAFVNTMFNAMNMKSFNEKKFDQVIVTLWIKGKYKDDPKKLETNLILLHIWEAFDWNNDGRQTLDEFSAFAEGYFGNEEDQKMYKRSYIDMIPGMDEKNLHDHLGARSLDFVQWLWASLEKIAPEERKERVQRCIKNALRQPGADQTLSKFMVS